MRGISRTIGIAVGFFFGSSMASTMEIFFKDSSSIIYLIVTVICMLVAMNVAYAIDEIMERKRIQDENISKEL